MWNGVKNIVKRRTDGANNVKLNFRNARLYLFAPVVNSFYRYKTRETLLVFEVKNIDALLLVLT